VPRRLRIGVEEKIDCEGKVLKPLKEEDVYAAAEIFKIEKVEAVAVNLLFGFANPVHEDKAYEILTKELPGVYVSLSRASLASFSIS